MQPDGHGLTMLPFLSGERAPGYHGEAHVTVTGINPATRAAHLVRVLPAVPSSTHTSLRAWGRDHVRERGSGNMRAGMVPATYQPYAALSAAPSLGGRCVRGPRQ
jgi:hypothetical protein